MPAKGNHQPQEAREKIRAFHKGREKSPEHRANLSAALRGKKRAPRSEETKKKIRDAQVGRKKSPEQTEKNRLSHLGQTSWNKGGTYGEETKQKIREARSRQVHPRFSVRGITQSDIDEATANGLRWCAGSCKAFLPMDRFYKNGATKRTVCAECGLSCNRLMGRAGVYKKYGVTEEWYNDTLLKQGGHCALCPCRAVPIDLSDESDRNRKRYLSIDHDHDTGLARGLLCGRCNLSLHRVEYVKGWSKRAIDYLLEHGSQVGKGMRHKDIAPDSVVLSEVLKLAVDELKGDF